MKKRLVAALLTACAIAASATTPAFGDPDGTVTASVSVAAPCIEVTPAALDFGVLGLSSAALPVSSALVPVEVRNCGTAREQLVARGTNANGSGGSSWTLVSINLCDAPNRFAQLLTRNVLQYDLSATDLEIGSPIGGAEVAQLRAAMVMPCAGSGGAGEVMTFSYIFTAVLA